MKKLRDRILQKVQSKSLVGRRESHTRIQVTLVDIGAAKYNDNLLQYLPREDGDFLFLNHDSFWARCTIFDFRVQLRTLCIYWNPATLSVVNR
jgi:hypothetical protein